MPEYRCDICEAVTADFMITAMANGDTLAIGIECLLSWAQAMHDQVMAAPDQAPAPPPEPAEPAPDPDRDWEADYPQGRSEGPETAPQDHPDIVRPDTPSTPAADVNR